MIKPVVLVILVLAAFLAAVLNLAAESRFRNTVMGCAIVAAVGIGAIFYGSGYAYSFGLNATSLMRALLTLCRTFGGVNDFGSIQASPLLQSGAGNAVFWFGHFCAFYVTASAAIATLGEKLLRRIRVTLLRRGPLLLIYGVNSSSVSYGKSMAANKKRSVLFIDPDNSSSFDPAIKAFGGVVDRSSNAVHPDKHFLKQINMTQGSRRLELAALHADGSKNQSFAEDLLEVLTDAGIAPSQTSLIISGAGESASSLQAHGGPGYGSVLAFDDYELTARIIMNAFPPCGRLTFDEHGKATEDFHAVILGYGRMGRAMLSHLLMNGQFSGSSFKADIFDAGPQNGFLLGSEIMKHYDIRFHLCDGRSDEFYSFLTENIGSVSCIVICTGNTSVNREIAEDITGWLSRRERRPLIIQTAKGSYTALDENGRTSECRDIYDSDVLDIDVIDAMAMQVHHIYTGNKDTTAAEDWAACGYFDRISSRANADFYPAHLKASGRTAKEILDGSWPPDEEMLENLAISEHERWCAFHYVQGFAPLAGDAFEERAARWLKAKETDGSAPFSLTKDMNARLHACLVPWEELDALSARVSEITGNNTDYKQYDRESVITLAEVLKVMPKQEEEHNE